MAQVARAKRGIAKGVTQMGWEKRKGSSSKYYTRSRRIGGRVVREYLGRGPLAEIAATLDAFDRLERENASEQVRQQREAAEAIDQSVKDLAKLCDLLVEVELLKSGYHKHKGEWRKRRVSPTDSAEQT